MDFSSRSDLYVHVQPGSARASDTDIRLLEAKTKLVSGVLPKTRVAVRSIAIGSLLLAVMALFVTFVGSRKDPFRTSIAQTRGQQNGGIVELSADLRTSTSYESPDQFLKQAMDEAKSSLDSPVNDRRSEHTRAAKFQKVKAGASDIVEASKKATRQVLALVKDAAKDVAEPVKLPKHSNASRLAENFESQRLKPLESRHDGNLCDTEEELWGGLCYRKCSLLTEGRRHVRKSPWTCCNDLPCDNVQEVAEAGFHNPFNAAKMCLDHCEGKVGSSIICNGYDIAGDGSCPHSPGACLTDEELHVGVCYKRCDLLTGGAYPFRSAAATCCKEHTEMGCLKLGASMTSPKFEVGGGAGDHDRSTPGGIHMPQEDLTEDVDATTTTSTAQPPEQPKLEGNLKPKETMNDGNVCGDTEELFDGLCYRKCSLLTNGASPIRTSAWTCCESTPCDFRKVHKAEGIPVMCNGYGVGGNGSCPHKPGACLNDEELHLGVCYKKCELLTGGKFPHRSAAATCCKSTGISCFFPSNVQMSKNFAVGGGKGDNDPVTPATIHAPMVSLTESSKDGDAEKLESHDEWSLFRVIGNGNVNVRRSTSPDSLVIDVKKEDSLVKGRRRNGWVELKEGGYMMSEFKGSSLLAQLQTHPQEESQ